MNGLSRILPLLLCLAALSASAAVSTNSVVVTPEPPVQIVTCRDDADVDGLLNLISAVEEVGKVSLGQ